MKPTITTPWPVGKFNQEIFVQQEDQIVTEAPLTIRVNGEEIATVVCSPAGLEQLTIGFLAAEGFIRFSAEIKQLTLNEERGFVDVELAGKQLIGREFYTKRWIGSCCGKSRQFYYHNDMLTAKTIMTRIAITPQQCFELMRELDHISADFQNTGGVHNAALCSTERVLFSYSDIGRHNALDKVYGHCLQNKLSMSNKVIAFSGRMSSEVVLKVAKMGIGLLLSKSAPTDLALKLANDLQITTIGFIRGQQMNIYTHPQRLILP